MHQPESIWKVTKFVFSAICSLGFATYRLVIVKLLISTFAMAWPQLRWLIDFSGIQTVSISTDFIIFGQHEQLISTQIMTFYRFNILSNVFAFRIDA